MKLKAVNDTWYWKAKEMATSNTTQIERKDDPTFNHYEVLISQKKMQLYNSFFP